MPVQSQADYLIYNALLKQMLETRSLIKFKKEVKLKTLLNMFGQLTEVVEKNQYTKKTKIIPQL